MLDGAGVGTRLDDRNGGFAAGFRHHLLHDAHQQVRRVDPAQARSDDLIALVGLTAAFEVRQGAQAVPGILAAAVDDAVLPGAVITLQLVVSASTTTPTR